MKSFVPQIINPENSIAKMKQLQSIRTNHVRHLATIYYEIDNLKEKAQNNQLERNHFLETYQKKRNANSQKKRKQVKDKIQYQNMLLYSKLAALTLTKSKKSEPSFSTQTTKMSPYKKKQMNQVSQQNQRMFRKLAEIKSEIETKMRIKQHSKNAVTLRNRVEKKSPRRKAYLKELLKTKYDYYSSRRFHSFQQSSIQI